MNIKPKLGGLTLPMPKIFSLSRRKRKGIAFTIEKRQKFVMGVVALSFGLFFTELRFNTSGIFTALLLSFFTDLVLLWAVYDDIKQHKTFQVFILPFFYSLAFGLFYPILKPQILLFHFLLSFLYGVGLYSVFLSQNIFIVSSIRTIQLLSSARIVSFIITLLSFFFFSNILFTFHTLLIVVILLMVLYTYLLVYHSLWTYTLQKVSQPLFIWTSALTVCLIEAAILLWFWPSNPTFISLFLTGFFYTIVGLSHIWFERRLFKGILWEYIWVGTIVFFVLILFTPWGK